MRDVIVQLAERRGIAVVCDSNNKVAGVITAGDLTRLMEKEENILSIPAALLMNRDPKVAEQDELGSAVVYRMEKHGIMSMPVVDSDAKLVGVVHLHDLMRAGVV
jgi:arabinose-5-phosphate isomerase